MTGCFGREKALEFLRAALFFCAVLQADKTEFNFRRVVIPRPYVVTIAIALFPVAWYHKKN